MARRPAYDRTGAAGASLRFPGVYGQTGDSTAIPLFQAGVYGASEAQRGVIGFSRSGHGVQGETLTGTAVSAYSFFGPAAYGLSGVFSGVTGISGVQGPPVPNLPTIAGIVGSSAGLPGVIGSAGLPGVIGTSTTILFAQTTSPAFFAGYFDGNVNITGTLTANVKNAVVRFPDGSKRVLHCMESPEHWFEDLGAARLKGGRAVVKLDANFAKVIKRGDYHVFLTPKGDCGGLYVRSQGGASFEVRELGGGKSPARFPIASSGGARTSRRTGASQSSIRACRCLQSRGRRPRPRCARSLPDSKSRHASALAKAEARPHFKKICRRVRRHIRTR